MQSYQIQPPYLPLLSKRYIWDLCLCDHEHWSWKIRWPNATIARFFLHTPVMRSPITDRYETCLAATWLAGSCVESWTYDQSFATHKSSREWMTLPHSKSKETDADIARNAYASFMVMASQSLPEFLVGEESSGERCSSRSIRSSKNTNGWKRKRKVKAGGSLSSGGCWSRSNAEIIIVEDLSPRII